MSLILIISGIVLLIKSVYAAGGIVLGLGVVFTIFFIGFYRSKKRRLEDGKKSRNWLDCIDCVDCPGGDCVGGHHHLDCHGADCTPDCSW